jgi:hypothetical protein
MVFPYTFFFPLTGKRYSASCVQHVVGRDINARHVAGTTMVGTKGSQHYVLIILTKDKPWEIGVADPLGAGV